MIWFIKSKNHFNLLNFEFEYSKDSVSWGLEAKLYSPYFHSTSIEQYKILSLDGPINDFRKLCNDFDHFIILLIQDEIDNCDGIEEKDYNLLKSTYNTFKLINKANLNDAKNHIGQFKNRVTELFKKAEEDTFKILAVKNGFDYSKEQGSITKNLIQNDKNCRLKIHFMINEFKKKV